MNDTTAANNVVMGCVVAGMPCIAALIEHISSIATFICLVTGAIIGIHGVVRLFRQKL